MEMLIKEYSNVLANLKAESFNLAEDKYSGVFLPVPFDEYWQSSIKLMLDMRTGLCTAPPRKSTGNPASLHSLLCYK